MTELIGHFHPLLVHLPIGILVLALVISLLPASKRVSMGAAFTLSLFVAAVSSAAACIAGYILSNSGDYEPGLVQNHQWLGIATCIFSFTAWLSPKYKRQILWGTVGLMMTASHMGGTITHGEGYLFSRSGENIATGDSTVTIEDTMLMLTTDTVSAPTATTKPLFLYRDQITPILKSKCYNCHSAAKKKGGLRLDTESFINKGGKNGKILIKGDANKSPMYTNLLLPLEDEKHMPPKGKKQISRAEIELIHRWIQRGAPFDAIEVSTAGPAIPSSSTPAEPADPIEESTPSSSQQTISVAQNTIQIPPADETVIISLQHQGVIVEKNIAGSNQLSVNFVNVKTINASTIQSLNELKEQVTELKFTGQLFTNDMLKEMVPFLNLKRLQLEKTRITDEGLFHLKKFRNLESLNLYGTDITDNGLKELTGSNLKKINLWNTKVTEQGIKTLKTKNPTLEVESGQLSLRKIDSSRKN